MSDSMKRLNCPWRLGRRLWLGWLAVFFRAALSYILFFNRNKNEK